MTRNWLLTNVQWTKTLEPSSSNQEIPVLFMIKWSSSKRMRGLSRMTAGEKAMGSKRIKKKSTITTRKKRKSQ
jgi:hypothetical protein